MDRVGGDGRPGVRGIPPPRCRAFAGPRPFPGPCPCLHRGPASAPKHGTGLVPGRHGHGGLRAMPGLSWALPCRATGSTMGRPVVDMYRDDPASGVEIYQTQEGR
jgi:hypothetical protein